MLMLVSVGCSSTKSLFFSNRNQQAIQRDTIDAGGNVRTTVDDPQFATNGTVKLAAVESLGLVQVPLEMPTGELPATFSIPRTLMVPPGFGAELFAHSLGSPRDLVLRDDGTLFYSSSIAGQIVAISTTGERTVVASGLKSPHGMEMHNGALYYTDETRVFRYDFASPTAVGGTSVMISDRLPPAGMNYHRTIKWSPIDKKFYIGVGSVDNRSVPDNPETGTVMRMSEGGGKPDVAMRGLRNTVALDIHPVTGDLWGVEEGADWVSMDLPPEEINILRVGRHYGWPFYYSRNFRDPDFMDADTIRQPKGEHSVIDLQAHSTPADMMFYRSDALGADWKNSMLITYHGSRDRTPPTGFKLVRVRSDKNGGDARVADVVTGFTDEHGEDWGQPVGIAVSADGTTFFLSDDRAGAIYRIYRTDAQRRR